MTKAQKEARARLNFATERLAAMGPDQRSGLTASRIVASYGVTFAEAEQLSNRFAWRA